MHIFKSYITEKTKEKKIGKFSKGCGKYIQTIVNYICTYICKRKNIIKNCFSITYDT